MKQKVILNEIQTTLLRTRVHKQPLLYFKPASYRFTCIFDSVLAYRGEKGRFFSFQINPRFFLDDETNKSQRIAGFNECTLDRRWS